MSAHMLYLHALTPVHAGTGQATGVIDLPVSREVTTGWPDIPGSTIKGVLRDACDPGPTGDATTQAVLRATFGPPTTNAADGAGNLWFTDARLLCLPVRSWAGSFAWVTCATVLRRWLRDHELGGLPLPVAHDAIPTAEATQIITRDDPAPAIALDATTVCLEDLNLARQPDPRVAAIAGGIADAALDASWKGQFEARFGIVSDDVFTFLTQTALGITARIRLSDQTKTVEQGALWYEESLPSEAILSCPLIAAPHPRGATEAQMFGLIAGKIDRPLQLGGHASVGRGIVRLRLSPTPSEVTK